MAYEQRDNSGTLGKNPRREKDSHPTHSGQCVIDGKPFWISAWVKEGRDGSKFFSLSFKPKMAAQANPRDRTDDDLPYDDQIPF